MTVYLCKPAPSPTELALADQMPDLLSVEERRRKPKVTFDASWGYVNVTLDTWHFLANRLELDEVEDTLFIRWSAAFREESYSYLADAEDFAERRHALVYFGERQTVNTYNHESLLEDTLQYTTYEREGETYVVMSVHRGGDVRGNYGQARVYRVIDGYHEGAYSLYQDGDYVLYHDAPEPAQVEMLPGFDAPEPDDHYFEHRGGEWSWDQGESYGDPWKQAGIEPTVEVEDGDDYVPCPKCGAALRVDVE